MAEAITQWIDQLADSGNDAESLAAAAEHLAQAAEAAQAAAVPLVQACGDGFYEVTRAGDCGPGKLGAAALPTCRCWPHWPGTKMPTWLFGR